MPTRFYLSNSAASYVPSSPLHRGTWSNGAAATAVALTGRPTGASTTTSVAIGSTTAGRSMLVMRGISPPALTAGTISGTVQWVIGVVESNTGLNAFWVVHIWVSVGDSTTVRGTLLNMSAGSTEWPTTYAGRGEGAKALTSVGVQAGDRIIVEFGYRTDPSATATTYTGTIRYGGTSLTDLTSGATDTTMPGWIELSGAEGMFSPAVSGMVSTFDSWPTSFLPNWYGAVDPTVTGGRLRLTATGLNDFAGAISNAEVQFDDDGFFLEIPTVLTAGSSTVSYFLAALVENNSAGGRYIGITVDTAVNQINFFNWDNYWEDTSTIITLDLVAHRWVRVRRSGASILWDTSPNGSTWTNRRTLATGPSWMNYRTNQLLLEVYKDTGPSSYAEVDNFNTVPATQDLSRSISDAATAADAVARVLLRPRPAGDTAATADTVTRLSARTRVRADTVGFAEALADLLAAGRAVSDASGLVDAAGRSLTRPGPVADLAGLADTAGRALVRIRAVAEAAAVVDTVARLRVGARPVADTAGLVDTVARLRAGARPVADTAGLADLLTRAPLARFRTVGDTAGLADTVARLRVGARPVADTAGLADTVAGAGARGRQLVDTATLVDTVARLRAGARAVTDTVALAEAVLSGRGVARDGSAFVFLNDAVAVSGAVLHRGGGDTTAVADEVLREFLLARETADLTGLADLAARGGLAGVDLADTVAGAAAGAAWSAAARSVADQADAVAGALAGQASSAGIADLVGVAVGAAGAGQVSGRVGEELLLPADTVGRAVAAAAIGGDTAMLAAELLAGRSYAAGAGELLHVAAGGAGQVGRFASVADTAAAGAAAARVRELSRDGSDFLFTGDIVVSSWVAARVLLHLLALADQVAAPRRPARTTADLLDLAEVVFGVVVGPEPFVSAGDHRVRMRQSVQRISMTAP